MIIFGRILLLNFRFWLAARNDLILLAVKSFRTWVQAFVSSFIFYLIIDNIPFCEDNCLIQVSSLTNYIYSFSLNLFFLDLF